MGGEAAEPRRTAPPAASTPVEKAATTKQTFHLTLEEAHALQQHTWRIKVEEGLRTLPAAAVWRVLLKGLLTNPDIDRWVRNELTGRR